MRSSPEEKMLRSIFDHTDTGAINIIRLKGVNWISIDFDFNNHKSRISIRLTKREWNNLIKFLKLTKAKRSLPKNVLGYFGLDLKTGKPIYVMNDKQSVRETWMKGNVSYMFGSSLNQNRGMFLGYGDTTISLDRKTFEKFRNLCLFPDRRNSKKSLNTPAHLKVQGQFK